MRCISFCPNVTRYDSVIKFAGGYDFLSSFNSFSLATFDYNVLLSTNRMRSLERLRRYEFQHFYAVTEALARL